MTLKELFKSTPEKERFIIGDAYFVLGRWENPNGTGSGNCTGPFFITVYGDCATFVDAEGHFKECVPSNADGYFPFLNRKSNKKTQLRGLLEQLLKKVA